MNDNSNLWNKGEIYLRYDRNDRLKRASQSVQQMYSPDYIKRTSMIKSLTATRASRSLLFAILAVFALSFASLLLKTDRQSGKICGIPVKMEYLSQQEQLYVNILFSAVPQQDDTYTLPITVRISASNRDTEQQETKTVEAVYIGSPLSIPAQFSAHTFQQLEAAVIADGKTLTLRGKLKK